MRTTKTAGQTTLEYIFLVVIVVAALISMQMYIKRGLQGRAKSSADDIGQQYGTTTNHWVKTTKHSKTTDTLNPKGSSTHVTDESTNKTEYYHTSNTSDEYRPK